MPESRKLYRSEANRVVGGVCAGLAAYLGVDSVLVRLVFAALALINGLGLIIYLIMWLIVPTESNRELVGEDAFRANVDDMTKQVKSLGGSIKNAPHSGVIFGVVLVVIGAMFLLDNFVPSLDPRLIWPIGLIAVGIYLLLTRRR
nr:PspC domain-containing protein [Anaerolineae bacterium]